MKKFFYAMIIFALTSCRTERMEPAGQSSGITFKASIEEKIIGQEADTKVSISRNGSVSYVLWRNGDEIGIYDKGLKLATYATTSDNSAVAGFKFKSGETLTTPAYHAFYPASAIKKVGTKMILSYPSQQDYISGDTAPGALMYACSETDKLNFKNLGGMLRVTVGSSGGPFTISKIEVSADQFICGEVTNLNTLADDSYIAKVRGGDVITVNFGSQGLPVLGGSTPNPSFYINIPANDYSSFRLKIYDINGQYAYVQPYGGNISIGRNEVRNINVNLDDEEHFITDLSANGTANCYIVPGPGRYKFKATVKGNGAADLGGLSAITPQSELATAALLWNTFSTSLKPAYWGLIQYLWYDKGYIHFVKPNNTPGNAVVAVKDGNGNIVWSWHLWCTDADLEGLKQGTKYKFMDRDLGALSGSYSPNNYLDCGLFYQWGRKDPFKGLYDRTDASSTVGAAGSAPNVESVALSSVDEGRKQPQNLDSGGGSLNSWEAQKNIFDPCPLGWRVPTAQEMNMFAGKGTWDESKKGFSFTLTDGTRAWFPASGLTGHGSTAFVNLGSYSCHYTSETAYAKAFDIGKGAVNAGHMSNKDSNWAISVRCVKDNVPAPQTRNYIDLSSGGTANSYVVPVSAGSHYKFKATIKGNGSADNSGISRHTRRSDIAYAELLWVSDCRTVNPIGASDMIKDIYYENGYVHFSIGDKPKDGNAVVAIRNKQSEILWSWHLWLTDNNPLFNKHYINSRNGKAVYIMDRNLGALVKHYTDSDKAGDFGLLYQWGRKDPFLSGNVRYDIMDDTGGKLLPSIYGTSEVRMLTQTTVADAIKSPHHFYSTDESAWASDHSQDLWASTDKTIFDPCPPGWKVPDNKLFKGDFKTQFEGGDLYTPTFEGFYVGDMWFPSAYFRIKKSIWLNTNPSVQVIYGYGRAERRSTIAIWTNNGILMRSAALNYTYWNKNGPAVNYAGLYDYSLLNTGREPLFKLSNGFSVRCVTE